LASGFFGCEQPAAGRALFTNVPPLAAELVQSLAAAASTLVARANDEGGRDSVTALVVQIVQPPQGEDVPVA